jgi:hypothetical protein
MVRNLSSASAEDSENTHPLHATSNGKDVCSALLHAHCLHTLAVATDFFQTVFLHCPLALVAAERGVRSANSAGPAKQSPELY